MATYISDTFESIDVHEWWYTDAGTGGVGKTWNRDTAIAGHTGNGYIQALPLSGTNAPESEEAKAFIKTVPPANDINRRMWLRVQVPAGLDFNTHNQVTVQRANNSPTNITISAPANAHGAWQWVLCYVDFGSYSSHFQLWTVEGGICIDRALFVPHTQSAIPTGELGFTNTPGSLPTIETPASGATLAANTQAFTWQANGTVVTGWKLTAGTDLNETAYYDGPTLTAGTLTDTATGLPTDGSDVFIRLAYSENTISKSIFDTYTASVAVDEPFIAQPLYGALLTSTVVPIYWNDPQGTSQFWRVVVADFVAGGTTWFDSGTLPDTDSSAVMTGLPNDGRALRATLFYQDGNGVGQSIEAVYIAYEQVNTGGGNSGATFTNHDFQVLDAATNYIDDADGSGGKTWLSTTGVAGYTGSGAITAMPLTGVPGTDAEEAKKIKLVSTSQDGVPKRVWVRMLSPSSRPLADSDAIRVQETSIKNKVVSLPANSTQDVWHWVLAYDDFLPFSSNLQIWTHKGGASVDKAIIIPAVETAIPVGSDGFTNTAEDYLSISVISPTNNSELAADRKTFSWINTGTGTPEAWLINAGSTPDGFQHFRSNTLPGSVQSIAIQTLPTDGSVIYVTLYGLMNGVVSTSRHTYVAYNKIADEGTPDDTKLIHGALYKAVDTKTDFGKLYKLARTIKDG